MQENARKVALITGAARGIGRGIAEHLSQKGYNIAIADVLSEDKAKEGIEACQQQGAEVVYIQSDISRSEDRERIVETIRKTFGRIDLLINNAGVAPKVRADILVATEESFDWVMSINLKGPYFLTQKIANWMIEEVKEDANRRPKIINIASISSYTSSPARGEYCISKAGISMMTKLYADRLSEFGINVYEIRPGIIMTDMTAKVKDKYDKLIAEGLTPIKRWGLPEDIAKAVCAIAEDYLPFSTGEVINLDGGFHLRRL